MSENNTHAARQIHHALRFRELVTQLSLTLAELDGDILDGDAIANVKNNFGQLDTDASAIVRSTRKLLD